MIPGRQLRGPLPTDEFNRLPLKSKTLELTGAWFNLRWKTYATPANTYFASLSGRMTPSSGKIPCLYLARDCETAFEELYGDFYDAAEKRGDVFTLSLLEARERVFVRLPAPVELRVYDLTSRGGAKGIGLDLGTLYAPDIAYTREFAQRLHDHPAHFDGVLYRSRLMSTRCVVAWRTYSAAISTLARHSALEDHFHADPSIDPDYYLFKRRTRLVTI